jgi:hypothetical protein
MYDPHPSVALNRAFAARPFQGAEPERATYLFVGLDANYSPLIEQNAVFGRVLDYLDDGVAFWKLHGVHHPFLLPEYRGDGRKYHKTFSAIGFRPEHADQVSFIEMMHVPTVGRSNLTIDDLDKDHLARLRDAIEHGDARHIFVPEGVARLMRESSMFEWIPKLPSDTGGALKIWRKTGSKTIYWHYHFSVYGKFEQKKADQLQAIGQLLHVPA